MGFKWIAGGLQPGSLQSWATDFGSGEPLIGLGAYSLGVYSLGVFSLVQRILHLALHSPDWEPTVWESTAWESIVSGNRMWICGSTHWTGSLQSGSLQSGSLQSGSLQSRATDFGSRQPLPCALEGI